MYKVTIIFVNGTMDYMYFDTRDEAVDTIAAVVEGDLVEHNGTHSWYNYANVAVIHLYEC